MQYLHACSPSADVILPSRWDKLERPLGICLCIALANNNHPGIYGYLWIRAGLRRWAGEMMEAADCHGPAWRPPAELVFVTLSFRTPQFPSQALLISLCWFAFPFPRKLPCLPAHRPGCLRELPEGCLLAFYKQPFFLNCCCSG